MGSEEEDQEKNLVFLNIGQVLPPSSHSSCLLWFMTIIRYVIIDENTTPHASFGARAVCSPPLASLFLPVVSHLWHVSPFSLSLSSDWISLPRFFTSVMYTHIEMHILQTKLGSVYIYYTRWPLSAFWLYALCFRFIIVVCVQMIPWHSNLFCDSRLENGEDWKNDFDLPIWLEKRLFTSLPIRNM